MEIGLGLIDGDGDGGGGGVSSGGSTNGSVSTVTKAEVVEQDYCMGLSSEVSSYNHSDSLEAELELGLGLSLGGLIKAKPFSRREYGRILTAKDLGSIGSIGSTSSSPTSGRGSNASASTVAGTKRAADSVQEVGASNGVSQVVGWPPVRAYRINSLVNQVKVPAEGDALVSENGKTISNSKKKSNTISSNNTSNVKEKGRVGSSLFVKVNMDGIAIGRKVDLNTHSCYETLAQTLEDMFHRPTTINNSIHSSGEEHVVEATRPVKLLDGSSDFVLTYEDKEGDWMLVGDVPWGMFLSTVKRLRIMRTSEVNGLAPRLDNSCERQRSKPI